MQLQRRKVVKAIAGVALGAQMQMAISQAANPIKVGMVLAPADN